MLGIAAALMIGLDLSVDHRHLFWRSLDPNQPAGVATYVRLLSLNARPESHCQSLLDATEQIEFVQVLPHRTNEQCGWDSAVRLKRSSDVFVSGKGIKLRCPMTIAVHLWIRDLKKVARDLYGAELRSVSHAGSYSCRRLNHSKRGAWSQHAYANAWDILGFTLSDGQSISVLKDWGTNTQAGDFLLQARDSACGIFGVVLGPEYNTAHRDHFHVDMGFGDACS